ncbi:Vacuolar membrane protease [Nowakowskiella sp. JEL0407]|nr:Vacuolar membrane protease [Nowakowskiella sp. JEL0407]
MQSSVDSATWEGIVFTYLHLADQFKVVVSAFAVILLALLLYHVDGPHQSTVSAVEEQLLWYGWWILLGISSSIGFGTGLHTFVMFLGPHIAAVTITAYTCKTLNFKVRGDDSFNCFDATGSSSNELVLISVWHIFSKVKSESFFWGLGTAIGELPPYFVARASSAAGQSDEEFSGFQNILEKDPDTLSIWEKLQVVMFNIMRKLGFWGILLCASVSTSKLTKLAIAIIKVSYADTKPFV